MDLPYFLQIFMFLQKDDFAPLFLQHHLLFFPTAKIHIFIHPTK